MAYISLSPHAINAFRDLTQADLSLVIRVESITKTGQKAGIQNSVYDLKKHLENDNQSQNLGRITDSERGRQALAKG